MSTTIEISRELAEQLSSGYAATRNQAVYVLRMLLAVPDSVIIQTVTDGVPVCGFCDACPHTKPDQYLEAKP